MIDKLVKKLLSPFPALEKLYSAHNQLFLYAISGVLSMIVSISTQYALAYILKTPAWTNTVMSWILAATAAFFMCRYWVYPESAQQHIARQAAKFYASRLAVLAIETFLMYISVDVAEQSEYVMKPLAQVFVAITNYMAGKLLIFKKKEGIDTNAQHTRREGAGQGRNREDHHEPQ